jgi:hypothetical protein
MTQALGQQKHSYAGGRLPNVVVAPFWHR